MTLDKDKVREALAANDIDAIDAFMEKWGVSPCEAHEGAARAWLDGQDKDKCAKGKDCDLTIAYMKGFEDGKDSVSRSDMVLVPRELTAEMERAWCRALDEDKDDIGFAYRAMIAAAEKEKRNEEVSKTIW